jgi:hypothetical protein
MSARVLTGLLDAISAAPNLERGLCVGNWAIFDDTDLPDEALELCRRCSVLQQWDDHPAALGGYEVADIVVGEFVARPGHGDVVPRTTDNNLGRRLFGGRTAHPSKGQTQWANPSTVRVGRSYAHLQSAFNSLQDSPYRRRT